jgi:hypothetical protein
LLGYSNGVRITLKEDEAVSFTGEALDEGHQMLT